MREATFEFGLFKIRGADDAYVSQILGKLGEIQTYDIGSELLRRLAVTGRRITIVDPKVFRDWVSLDQRTSVRAGENAIASGEVHARVRYQVIPEGSLTCIIAHNPWTRRKVIAPCEIVGPGIPSDTTIVYNPWGAYSSVSGNAVVALVHELGHALFFALGASTSRIAVDVEMIKGWSNFHEYWVIHAFENPLRERMGLPLRTTHKRVTPAMWP